VTSLALSSTSSYERSLLIRVVAWLLARLVRWWIRTLRVSFIGPMPPSGPVVFAFHHGRQFGLLRYPHEGEVTVLSSLSRDGTLQARVLRALGYAVVRGSSSRGGAAGLLALVRCLRRGSAAALAVDGPRGPLGKVKPGVVGLAASTGATIVPVAASASRGWRLHRSWDRFFIPAPWSRVVLVSGPSCRVARRAGAAVLERHRTELQQTLTALNAEADRQWG
jgi:lysophospholipid acyltransferase (LPLAT)-like uncharacterized protein